MLFLMMALLWSMLFFIIGKTGIWEIVEKDLSLFNNQFTENNYHIFTKSLPNLSLSFIIKPGDRRLRFFRLMFFTKPLAVFQDCKHFIDHHFFRWSAEAVQIA